MNIACWVSHPVSIVYVFPYDIVGRHRLLPPLVYSTTFIQIGDSWGFFCTPSQYCVHVYCRNKGGIGIPNSTPNGCRLLNWIYYVDMNINYSVINMFRVVTLFIRIWWNVEVDWYLYWVINSVELERYNLRIGSTVGRWKWKSVLIY